MENVVIRPFFDDDNEWKVMVLKQFFGTPAMVRKGELINVTQDSGYIALLDGHPSGLVTYRGSDCEIEITSLVSLIPGKGIGSRLLGEIIKKAKEEKNKKIWLIITNDNISGLKFYQKRGFVIAKLYPNALEEARKIQPEIPMTGLENIPLRDEIELHFEIANDTHL